MSGSGGLGYPVITVRQKYLLNVEARLPKAHGA
jgi:hypothetical protein